MVTSKYPNHKVDEVTKLFTEKKVPELADFVKLINIFFPADFNTKAYALFEAPNDKLYDALMSISARYGGYRNIEGFKFKIEPVASIEDLQQTT
jgi:hypothetical protein